MGDSQKVFSCGWASDWVSEARSFTSLFSPHLSYNPTQSPFGAFSVKPQPHVLLSFPRVSGVFGQRSVLTLLYLDPRELCVEALTLFGRTFEGKTVLSVSLHASRKSGGHMKHPLCPRSITALSHFCFPALVQNLAQSVPLN